MAVYEQMLAEKNGRKTPASRSWQKVRNKGLLPAMIDWVRQPPTDGFKWLVNRGLSKDTTEYLVVKHAEQFPSEIVKLARKRLADAG